MVFSRPGPPFRELEEFRRNIDDMLEHLSGKTGYSIRSGLAVWKPHRWSPLWKRHRLNRACPADHCMDVVQPGCAGQLVLSQ